MQTLPSPYGVSYFEMLSSFLNLFDLFFCLKKIAGNILLAYRALILAALRKAHVQMKVI